MSEFVCDVNECENMVFSLSVSLCPNHYAMKRKHGVPNPKFICANCKQEYVFNGVKLNSTNFCPECFSIYSRFWSRRFNSHKISVFDFYKMLISQDEKCKICKSYEKLQIDHDPQCCPSRKGSSCGKCIRGLLCNNCNTMLAFYEKGKGILIIEQFENYLKESREK